MGNQAVVPESDSRELRWLACRKGASESIYTEDIRHTEDIRQVQRDYRRLAGYSPAFASVPTPEGAPLKLRLGGDSLWLALVVVNEFILPVGFPSLPVVRRKCLFPLGDHF